MPDWRVTTLIPSYGRPQSLQRCLAGLLQLERPPDEIIVICRHSDMETQAVAKGFPYVQTAYVSRPGQIAAINVGLSLATGDIVSFLDDDCVPRIDWLSRLLPHYANPQVGGVGGRDVVGGPEAPEAPFAKNVGVITCYGRIIGNHHSPTTPQPRAVAHLKGANMSFRRVLLSAFDERIRGPHYNDTEISLRVRQQGYWLVYDPLAIVDHYPAPRLEGPGGRDSSDPQLAYLDAHDRMYVLLKHMPWLCKPLAAAYQLVIGTRRQPGLLSGVFVGWRTPRQTIHLMKACLCGSLAGIATACRYAAEEMGPHS